MSGFKPHNGFASVPIVGGDSKKRTWKMVRQSLFLPIDPQAIDPHTGKTVGEQHPMGLFLVSVEGHRSDDLPCAIQASVDGRMFSDPRALGELLSRAWAMLETYRTCPCRPHQPCSMHAPPRPVKSVGSGTSEAQGDGDPTALVTEN